MYASVSAVSPIRATAAHRGRGAVCKKYDVTCEEGDMTCEEGDARGARCRRGEEDAHVRVGWLVNEKKKRKMNK